jgi:hypothetical protein
MVFNGIDEDVGFSFVVDKLSVFSRLENKLDDELSLSSSSRSGITYERVAIFNIGNIW